MVKLVVRTVVITAVCSALLGTPASATVGPEIQAAASVERRVDCSCWLPDDATRVGISIRADASCANEGPGCIGTSCRFCRTHDTPESMRYEICSPLASPRPTTLATETVSAAATPSVAAAVVPSAVDACAHWLSPGDRAVGIAVKNDASCVQGGLGCIGLFCRYCSARDSPESSHFRACGTLSQPAAPPAPEEAAASLPASAVATPSASAPADDAPADDACARFSTPGDRAAGIELSSDASCAGGGVGCIGGTTCRFCRVKDSDQSKSLLPCSPSTEASAVAPPPANADETCARLSTSGDRSVGILVARDVSCVSGGTGCLGTSCRLCRSKETTQSSHLLPCTALPIDSAVVTVASLSTTAEQDDSTSNIWVWALVLSGIGAAVGVLAFVVKRKAPHWQNQALKAPMCIEPRRSSLSGI